MVTNWVGAGSGSSSIQLNHGTSGGFIFSDGASLKIKIDSASVTAGKVVGFNFTVTGSRILLTKEAWLCRRCDLYYYRRNLLIGTFINLSVGTPFQLDLTRIGPTMKPVVTAMTLR